MGLISWAGNTTNAARHPGAAMEGSQDTLGCHSTLVENHYMLHPKNWLFLATSLAASRHETLQPGEAKQKRRVSSDRVRKEVEVKGIKIPVLFILSVYSDNFCSYLYNGAFHTFCSRVSFLPRSTKFKPDRSISLIFFFFNQEHEALMQETILRL